MRLKFHDPQNLLDQTKIEIFGIPEEKFFNEGVHQGLQDKWGAAMFGVGFWKYVRPCKVAMNESRERMDADFFLEASGEVFPFQFTERQAEGRRRGEEYKRRASIREAIAREPEHESELLTQLMTPYRPVLGSAMAPEWIEHAIAKKAERYGKCDDLNLVVYANFHAWDLSVDAAREKTAIHRDSFSSIWVITNTAICSLFSNARLGRTPDGGWGHL